MLQANGHASAESAPNDAPNGSAAAMDTDDSPAKTVAAQQGTAGPSSSSAGNSRAASVEPGLMGPPTKRPKLVQASLLLAVLTELMCHGFV